MDSQLIVRYFGRPALQQVLRVLPNVSATLSRSLNGAAPLLGSSSTSTPPGRTVTDQQLISELFAKQRKEQQQGK